MGHKFFRSLLAAVCLSFVSSDIDAAPADVVITGRAGQGNPTLYFGGVKGNSRLSAALKSDLKECGWFDLVHNAGAKSKVNYVIRGSVSNGFLTLESMSKNAGSVTIKVQITNDVRATAHSVADALLKKYFGVKKLCQSKIAFCAERRSGVKEIYVCDFDGKNMKPVTSSNTLSVEPSWVPGKNQLVYTRYRRSQTDVLQVDLASRKTRRIAKYPGLNSGAAVSPDGRTIALTLSKDGQVELYRKPLERRGETRLTRGRSVEASPVWSPDGRQICYVSDMVGRPKLFRMNSNGSGVQMLPTLGTESVEPDWSRNNKIVYSAKMGRQYVIAVTDLTNGKKKVISKGSGNWEQPTWAPDGRHVICSRSVGGRSSLYRIDSFTGKSSQFLKSTSNLSQAAWSE